MINSAMTVAVTEYILTKSLTHFGACPCSFTKTASNIAGTRENTANIVGYVTISLFWPYICINARDPQKSENNILASIRSHLFPSSTYITANINPI